MNKKEKTKILSSAPPEKWGHFVNYEYIYMLEQYCESNNIKLVWSFWDLDMSGHHSDHEIFKKIGFDSSLQFLKSKFKNFYTDIDNFPFDTLIRNLSFDKKGNLSYSELCPHELMNCHKTLQCDTKDFFEVAYDRYLVPEVEQLQIEKHLQMSRLEKDKNLTTSYGYLAHFGSHRNIHWAEFYFNIIKEKYPEFI